MNWLMGLENLDFFWLFGLVGECYEIEVCGSLDICVIIKGW